MSYVIIGNSAAAVGCIEAIRTIDPRGKITVISKENRHTYSRPLISYWLKGDVADDKMLYRKPDFYENNKVSVMLGRTAQSIDTRLRQVVLQGGETVPYKKLLIATGSLPFVPKIKGVDGPDIYTFLSWDDAASIKAAAKEGMKAVVLGAGLIGLKAAEGLYKYTKDITVIDLADRILPSILDTDSSAIIKERIEARGVKFILGQSASDASDHVLTLSSGEKLNYDMLVVAVGVRPNITLAQNANIAVEKGIITDKQQMTNYKDIYAAGDCTQSYDITTGSERVLALLPNAFMQGRIAGFNMAEGGGDYKNAIPLNSIGFFGSQIMSAGSYAGEEVDCRSEKGYKKLFVKDGFLKGFILIDDVDRAGIYTRLIRETIPLETVDFELLKCNPQVAVLSADLRHKAFEGGKIK